MLYGRKWHEYAPQWDAMKIKAVIVNTTAARFAVDHRGDYARIEQATGVPWAMIACIHRRESDGDFTTYLGNGDPLRRKTVNEPRGRGPFESFFSGAIDALQYDHLNRVTDWRLEKVLYYLEAFNGAGYDVRGKPSPYLWAGTNNYTKGKFVADGRYSANAIDRQPGCAAILKLIMDMDESVAFMRED